MHYSIGKHLGIILAHFEYDSVHNPDDLETLQKIRLISEAYKNFSNPEYGTFREDFRKGYEMGAADVREIEKAKFEGTESAHTGDASNVDNNGPNIS